MSLYGPEDHRVVYVPDKAVLGLDSAHKAIRESDGIVPVRDIGMAGDLDLHHRVVSDKVLQVVISKI